MYYMKDKFIGSIIFLIGILAVGLFLAPFIKSIEAKLPFVEGFSGLYDLTTPGTFPKSVDQAILDDYPLIGKNETSNKNYSDIWWEYPIFGVGSFKQVTNNLRYHDNPDQGTCIRADFCNALYYNKKDYNSVKKSNITTPLPPAEEGPGARVGYFRTEPNELYYSIPTNENILY
jgi:hypothetical protein